MRELWNASHGALGDYSYAAPGLLWVWWLTWVVGTVTGYGDSWSELDVIGLICLIISALALWLIIDKVTVAQQTIDISDTFA